MLKFRAVSSSGIFTHTEIAHRALLNYDSEQFGARTVRSLLMRRQAAFQGTNILVNLFRISRKIHLFMKYLGYSDHEIQSQPSQVM